MIFVDTSVWVAFLRGRDAEAAAHLSSLLDADEVALAAPVRIEILSGARRADLRRLRILLSALPTHYPGKGTWERIGAWVERAASVGERFGLGDLLVGAIAADAGGSLWSLDRDFERLSKITGLALHRVG